MKIGMTLAAVVGLATAATAQNVTFTLKPSAGTINVGETVSVELWAQMDAPVFAFGAAKIDINNMQNGTNGTISNIALSAPLAGGGVAAANGNNDLKTFTPFQVHFPPLFPANTANPILVASFDWTANSAGKVVYAVDVLDDLGFTNRVVVIATSSGNTANRLGVESEGGWNVIPAPSSLALLGLGGLVAARRRR